MAAIPSSSRCRDVYTRVHLTTLQPSGPWPRLSSMNFAFSEEQEELRKVVSDFLNAKSDEATVRELMETESGYDEAVWSQMAEQDGSPGARHPRGVRRLGLLLSGVDRGARGDGSPVAVRSLLLHRGAGRQRPHCTAATRPPRRTCSRESLPARPSPPWRSPSPAASGTRPASPWRPPEAVTATP